MAFERWNRRFEGPFFVPDFLKHEAGVYVIWCNKGDSWTILDVGEALDVKKKVSDQENLTCWQKHCNGKIYYSATYTEAPGLILHLGFLLIVLKLFLKPCRLLPLF